MTARRFHCAVHEFDRTPGGKGGHYAQCALLCVCVWRAQPSPRCPRSARGERGSLAGMPPLGQPSRCARCLARCVQPHLSSVLLSGRCPRHCTCAPALHPAPCSVRTVALKVHYVHYYIHSCVPPQTILIRSLKYRSPLPGLRRIFCHTFSGGRGGIRCNGTPHKVWDNGQGAPDSLASLPHVRAEQEENGACCIPGENYKMSRLPTDARFPPGSPQSITRCVSTVHTSTTKMLHSVLCRFRGIRDPSALQDWYITETSSVKHHHMEVDSGKYQNKHTHNICS